MKALLAQSYWVIPKKLLAGPYPGGFDADKTFQNLKTLLDCGICHLINLTESKEPLQSRQPLIAYEEILQQMRLELHCQVSYTHIPIVDFQIPSYKTMKRILGEIDQAFAQNFPVYVHCWGGKGRTGTVIGCYLARHNIASGPEILKKIQSLRQMDSLEMEPSPETEQQRAMVTSWKIGD